MSKAPRGVLIAHAGRHHSPWSAAALEHRGLLGEYWTGVPLEGFLARPVPGLSISSSRLVTARWCPLLRRTIEGVVAGRAKPWGEYLSSRAFDRWASRRLASRRFAAVIGYEIGCARLLAAARAAGVVTILEAPSLHHAWQDRWRTPPESAELHSRLRATKELELSRADHVIVASGVSAQSYRDAGFDPDRIWTIPLGVDLEQFPRGSGGDSSSLSVLFAGKFSQVKGLDVLLAAHERAREKGAALVLRLAGQGRRPVSLPAGAVLGKLSPERLSIEYGRADVAVLPSRFDGFGLVVPEALSCGTPVIVSDRVGAKDLIREGVNGWIVPAEDVEALAGRLVWCAENLDRVRSMRRAAAESARASSWSVYCERFESAVRGVLEMGRK